MDVQLCVGFSTRQWMALSERLDRGDQDAWVEAIAVFERRIRERFLRSIDALVLSDTTPDLRPTGAALVEDCIPGFSIMALCCLLIETLQSFREELPQVPYPPASCSFPTGPCAKPTSGTNQQFLSFLRRPAFGEAFAEERLAKKFMNGVRNGILHEAETRGWVIWREEPVGQIVARADDGLALNRTLFYAAVKQEFGSYLQDLGDPLKHDLRQRFRKKMDDLVKEA